jgi:predicted metal-dependent phosphoesterase TrpH
MKPNELVRAAVSKGYDILGVVDHDTTKGSVLTKKIAGKKIIVIPGEEIKTSSGDLIVLLSDGKYVDKDLMEVCKRAKEMGHFVFAPHPFDAMRSKVSLMESIGRVRGYLQAMEIFNSRVMLNSFNRRARDYALKNHIRGIAGSDAHFVEEVGNAANYLECERNIDSIFEFIRKNPVRIEGKRTSILSHMKSGLIKINRNA